MDGTDYWILEPGNPTGRFWTDRKGNQVTCNPKWYSHKCKGPGVRYEIAVCIQTGDIVWTNGPFPCGRWPDKKIFNHGLIHELDDDEMVEGDKGYVGSPFHCRTPHDYQSKADKRAKKKARARHETVNRRLKQFGCLGNRYRHSRSKHKCFFRAAAVCVQLTFEHGHPLFQVRHWWVVVTLLVLVTGNVY